MAGIPPGIDVTENQQPMIIGSVSATWVLSTIALALRFWCRRLSKANFWWDDYFMLSAYAFSSACTLITLTFMLEAGLGKHIYVQPPEQIPKSISLFFKNLLAIEILYGCAITFAKYSILAFYWRLFSRSRFVRWSTITIAVIVGLSGLESIIICVVQCRPLKGFWDKTIPAVCDIDSKKFFYGNSIPSTITDVFILLLPLPVIWSLGLQLKQKVSLSMIFLLGFFVTAISIIRLVALLNLDISSADVTWAFMCAQTWTCHEMNLAVVCGCLPQLRPLLHFINTGINNSLRSSNRVGNTSRSFGGVPVSYSTKESRIKSHSHWISIGDKTNDLERDTRLIDVPTQGREDDTYEMNSMENGTRSQPN